MPRRDGLLIHRQYVGVVWIDCDMLEGLELDVVVVVEFTVGENGDVFRHARGPVVLSNAGNRHDDVVGKICRRSPFRVHLNTKLHERAVGAKQTPARILVDEQHRVLHLLRDEGDASAAHCCGGGPGPGLLQLRRGVELVVALEPCHPLGQQRSLLPQRRGHCQSTPRGPTKRAAGSNNRERGLESRSLLRAEQHGIGGAQTWQIRIPQ